MADTIGARLKAWREVTDVTGGDNWHPAEWHRLLADAERMHSVLVEYGKARAAREAYPNSPSKGGAETWSKRVFALDQAVHDAQAAVESLALELAEEEDQK